MQWRQSSQFFFACVVGFCSTACNEGHRSSFDSGSPLLDPSREQGAVGGASADSGSGEASRRGAVTWGMMEGSHASGGAEKLDRREAPRARWGIHSPQDVAEPFDLGARSPLQGPEPSRSVSWQDDPHKGSVSSAKARGSTGSGGFWASSSGLQSSAPEAHDVKASSSSTSHALPESAHSEGGSGPSEGGQEVRAPHSKTWFSKLRGPRYSFPKIKNESVSVPLELRRLVA